MPGPLPLTWMEQLNDMFCGPAVAAMILKALGVAAPQGVVSDADWQNALWEDIKDVTTGPRRPKKASTAPGFVQDFKKQQCFKCPELTCWGTTPQALRDTLNRHLPSNQRMKIERDGSFSSLSLLGKILDSIDAGVPAVAGVGDRTHWVVVYGYEQGGPGQSVTVGSRQVASVYLLDSQADSPDAELGLMPVGEFVGDLLFVECGAKVDKGKSIAIARRP